eukprot:6215400-Pyramimonas_sp.AAC.1
MAILYDCERTRFKSQFTREVTARAAPRDRARGPYHKQPDRHGWDRHAHHGRYARHTNKTFQRKIFCSRASPMSAERRLLRTLKEAKPSARPAIPHRKSRRGMSTWLVHSHETQHANSTDPQHAN